MPKQPECDVPSVPEFSQRVRCRLKEVGLIVTLLLAVYVGIALFTFNTQDPSWFHFVSRAVVQNAGGRVGAWLSSFLLFALGYVSFLLPLIFLFMAGLLFKGRCDQKRHWGLFVLRAVGVVLFILSSTGLTTLLLAPGNLPSHQAGGVIGGAVGNTLVNFIGFDGAALILTGFFLISVTLFTGLSWFEMLEQLGKGVTWAWCKVSQVNYNALFARTEKQELKQAAVPVKPIEPEIITLPPRKPKEKLVDDVKIAKKVKQKKPVKKLKQVSILAPDQIPEKGALPVLSLLDEVSHDDSKGYSSDELRSKSQLLEVRLKEFGVDVKVVAVHPGPVVTRFELDLAAGTKVSKITNLGKDLARSLSVVSVRVVEVIPGKSYVGLELPNETRELVGLREVLNTEQFDNARAPLSLALGKDIGGHAVVVDLAKMPHLLVAGTTGSGKSVGINTMLMSMLYKSSPKNLRLIMIDPKMLELSVYDDIPHLLAPVVTDMNDAATALRWCVVEMERRYKLMAALGVRNLAGFNAKVVEALQQKKPLLDPLVSDEAEAAELEELPKIVVVADEFADMMVVVGKKVESLITRLAQKARAAGIHLILATQRPSVDVITGIIKANIPTRIAFQVSSKIDSRTILDQGGADQLLGHGDMLYLAPGSGVPVRVHGAFVSDDDVHRVVEYLKMTGSPDYLEDVLDDTSGEAGSFVDAVMGASGSEGDAEQDAYYDQAVEFVTKARRVSISSVQRRFKIGYNRAANIVEAMEAAGVVSSMEGNGSREVLAPPPPGE